MSRSLVFLRDAIPADAAILAELWVDVLRRGDEADRVADIVRIVETAGQDPTSASSWRSTTAGSPAASTCG